MAEKARLQVKTTADPEKWEDVGASAEGVPVPVSIESGDIEIGAVEIKNPADDTRAVVDTDGLAVKATIKETVPTHSSKSNASLVLAYTGSNLTTITKTISSVDYQKILTYDGSDNLTGVSAWVQV